MDQSPTQENRHRVRLMLDECCKFLLDTDALFKSTVGIASSQRTCTQLLMLQYLHFHLMQVEAFMSKFSTSYATKRHEQLDPQKVSLTRSVLSEVAMTALLVDELRNLTLAATDLLNCAVDILGESMDNSVVTQQPFRLKRAEIRAECLALDRLASRLVERFESRLKFFELFRGVQDSVSIWLLTLLAAMFLPLSLASGILSMQTRFAKLHLLLYDFIGVVTIIESLIGLVFLGLKGTMTLADWLTKTRVRSSILERMVSFAYIPAVFVASMSFPTFWGLIFTSFMVGMIKDVALGLKILGFGMAAYLGSGMLGLCILFFLIW